MNAPRGTKIAATVFLLLVGVLTAINSVGLSHLLDEQNRARPQDAQIQRLASRVADLAQRVEPLRQAPDAVPLSHYEAERKNMERRLAAVEQAVKERPSLPDSPALRERLARLEQRLKQRPPPAAPRPAPAEATPPKVPDPAFQVIGAEQRAGERFLAILPSGANALSQARLLRIGEREEGWRLEAIYLDTAVFSQAGQIRRLSMASSPEKSP
jgi:hypothetical protein